MSTPIPELTSLQTLINTLDELPYCTGTVPLDPKASALFYHSGDSKAESLDFCQPTQQQLEALAKACQPATFGLNKVDVLDESYRKAGKMDANHFATQFSPIDLGILEVVNDHMLRGRVDKAVHLELYKLNVYGPGGFFKAHVDTPRGDTMFGSLVVVFPTVHEGGSLAIRHRGKEWTFDSAKAVNTESAPHAAFVVFFSDIEHEVMPVTSGYRLTLTYNLYLKKKVPNPSVAIPPFGQTDTAIQTALNLLLKNPDFLPDGGLLGFGLAHKYAFNPDSTVISTIADGLKGMDAAIKRACELLGLPVMVKALYDDEYNIFTILLDDFAHFRGDEIEDLRGYLKQFRTIPPGGHNQDDSDRFDDDDNSIVWIKPLADTNVFSSRYISHGNEPSLGDAYGEICLVVTIDSAQQRNN